MGNLTSTDCISWHMAVVRNILAIRDKSREKNILRDTLKIIPVLPNYVSEK